MSHGYEDFFKKARAARDEGKPPKAAKGRSTKLEDMGLTAEDVLHQKLQVKKVKPKAKFPFGGLFIVAAISAVLGWWSVDPDLPQRLSKHVEISWMGAAEAEGVKSEEKNSATKADRTAESSATKSETKSDAQTVNGSGGSEDTSQFSNLRERKAALDLREKELNKLEEELQRQKDELDARIKQLEDLRAQISGVLKERVEVDQERVMKLVETYSNMRPKQAAEILAGIDEDLAVEVLGKMKKKNAAEIMNLLEPGKARAISEKYAGYRRR